jgi:hypothetical protein
MFKINRRTAVLVAVGAFAFAASPAQAADDRSTGVASVQDSMVTGKTVTNSSGKTVDQPASQDRIAAAAAGCWYSEWSRRFNNVFGMRLATYYLRLDWCSNSTRITSSSHRRWGETSMPGWSFEKHIGRQVTGGNGSTFYRVWSQGHFCLVKYFSCVQNWYPWIEMTATPGGGITGRQGG